MSYYERDIVATPIATT